MHAGNINRLVDQHKFGGKKDTKSNIKHKYCSFPGYSIRDVKNCRFFSAILDPVLAPVIRWATFVINVDICRLNCTKWVVEGATLNWLDEELQVTGSYFRLDELNL